MRIFQINHHSLASSRLFHLRVLTFLPRHSEFFHVHLSILRKMPPSKTLMDFFPMPNAKRPKTNLFTSSGSEKSACTAGEAIDSVPSSSTNTNNDGFRDSTATLTLSVATGSSLTVDERAKIEFKKSVAQSKRNAKICLQKLAHAKGEAGRGYVLLEELLVEETWLNVLSGELQKPYAKNLCKFVEKEICSGTTQIYPPSHLIFNALNSTPYDKVKVVILGQDPYHGPGQATGLCFSVPEGVKIPSSLVNIFKEIKNDLGCAIPSHGNLEKWALQGVLLLNTVLTVRSHQANSHAKKGWEQFTDAVIQTISQNKSGVVFLLWGNSAQAKSRFIDMSKHHILKAAHPSGLSANRGFFGCRHFSRTNKILEEGGEVPIDWQL